MRGRNCAETKQSRPLSLPYDVQLRIDKEPIMESHRDYDVFLEPI